MSSNAHVYSHFRKRSNGNVVYVTPKEAAEIQSIQKYYVACSCKHSNSFPYTNGINF